MVKVFKLKNYNIYSNLNGGYIVHNTKKPFEEGHTHINSFNTAKYVLHLSLYKQMPKNNHLSNYLIESVIRISDNREYILKIKSLKKNEKDKKRD